ncbi:Nn.00g107820.m01.CDS01 [Neocucurbitaria sp. VM-36]
MVSQSSPRGSVEEHAPFLTETDIATPLAALPPPKKKPWVLLVLLIFALVAIVDIGAFLAEPPKTRVFEANLCLTYYREHDPSAIGKDGAVPEQLCKVDEVQQKLAMIFGWQDMFDALPGILLAVPFGTLADKIGRKWIFTASLMGLQLSSAWVLMICYFKTLPLQFTWFSSVFFFIGGGPIVAMAIGITMVADIVPPEKRTSIFLYLTACVLVAEMVAPIMASRLMEKGDWLPLLLALAIQQVGICIAFLFPETLHLRDLPEPRDGEDPDIELQPKGSHFTLKAQLRNFQTAIDFIKSDWTLCLVVFTFLANRLGRQAITLLVRYASKRYSWEIKKAAYLLSFRAATNLVSITIFVPLLNYLLLKRFRLPAHWADLWIARGSIVLTTISFFVMGIATHPALLIIGLLIYNLGTGYNAAMRSVSIHVVGGQSSPDVGKLMSTIAIAESIGAMVAGPLLNEMFQWGMDLGSAWLGLPFLGATIVFAGMTVVTMMISVKDKEVAYVEVLSDDEDLMDDEEEGRTSALEREVAPRHAP